MDATVSTRLELQRIFQLACDAVFSGDMDYISKNPVIVLPDVKTAIQVIANSDEFDPLMYTQENHDAWVRTYNYPIHDLSKLSQFRHMGHLTNIHRAILANLEIIKANKTDYLQKYPQYNGILSEFDSMLENFPKLKIRFYVISTATFLYGIE